MTIEIKTRGDGFQWAVSSEIPNSNCGLYDHEDWIFNYLMVPPGGVFLDVGSFVGTHAIITSRNSKGIAYAFEPIASNFALLKQNIQLNSPNDVRPVNLAIGSENKSAFIGTWDDNGFTCQISDSGLPVQVVTLDSYMLPLDLPAIQVVKIDVEGYETEVLNGMKQIAARYNPRIIVEVHSHFKGRENNGNLIADWCTEMKYTHRRIWENEPAYFYLELNPK
jgi:FkbM family methyltransferase